MAGHAAYNSKYTIDIDFPLQRFHKLSVKINQLFHNNIYLNLKWELNQRIFDILHSKGSVKHTQMLFKQNPQMQRKMCALRNNLHVSRNDFSPSTFISGQFLVGERYREISLNFSLASLNVSLTASTLSLIKFLSCMSLISKVDPRFRDVFVSEKQKESESKFTMIVGGYLTHS